MLIYNKILFYRWVIMHCKQCGFEYNSNAKYCSNCGDSLLENEHDFIEYEVINQNNHYQAPADDSYHNEELPKIWNPNVIGCWALFLTPLFGSVLIMKNWKALGYERQAQQAQLWGIVFLIYVLVAGYLEISASRLSLLYLLIWYFFSVKKQVTYVEYELNYQYIKKSILMPVIITVIVIISIITVFNLFL